MWSKKLQLLLNCTIDILPSLKILNSLTLSQKYLHVNVQKLVMR